MSLLQKTIDSMENVVSKAQSGTHVLSLEAQKKAKEATMHQAINHLNEQKEHMFGELGKKYYELVKAGSDDESQLSGLLGSLDDFNSKISEQEKAIEEMKKKFDEEIAQIKNAVHQKTCDSATGECPKCGKKFNVGADLFCADCGEDLRNITEAKTEAKAEEAPKLNVCPKCGAEFNPKTALFCRKCGNPLKEILAKLEKTIEKEFEHIKDEVTKEIDKLKGGAKEEIKEDIKEEAAEAKEAAETVHEEAKVAAAEDINKTEEVKEEAKDVVAEQIKVIDHTKASGEV